jgi:hypothetical protein
MDAGLETANRAEPLGKAGPHALHAAQGDGSSWWVVSTGSGSQIYGGTKYGGCTDKPVTSA